MKNFLLKTLTGIFLMSLLTNAMFAASQDPAPENASDSQKKNNTQHQQQQTNYGMTDYYS